MKVSVRPLKGEPFDVELQPEDTIDVMKAKIAAVKEDMPPAAQKIVFSGKVLTHPATVQECGLKEGDFVVVMVSKGSATATVAPAAVPSLPGSVPEADDQAQATHVGDGGMEASIEQLCAMGFPRQEVERALRAAFGNADRAVEYLMSGVPAGILEQGSSATIPSAAAPVPASTAAPVPPAPSVMPGFPMRPGVASMPASQGPLAKLLDNPRFNQLRLAVQQNPQTLNQVLSVIHQQDPSLTALIAEHQEEFVAALQEPVGAGSSGQHDPVAAMIAAAHAAQAGGGTQGGAAIPDSAAGFAPAAPVAIQLSAAEQEAVGRLQALGFDRRSAVEAYLACDRNEEVAANYLFEAMEQD